MVLLYLPIGLLFLTVGALSRVSEDMTLSLIMRNPVIMGELPYYTGFVPQVGALLWCASLTVCLFSLTILHQRDDTFRGARRFLLQAAILTGLLMADDIFLFHGEIAPKLLNISSVVIVTGYLVMALLVVSVNWREILLSEYLILLLALVLFGASISFDAFSKLISGLPQMLRQFMFFFEDGFKFAGTATWLVYFARFAGQQLNMIHTDKRPSFGKVPDPDSGNV